MAETRKTDKRTRKRTFKTRSRQTGAKALRESEKRFRLLVDGTKDYSILTVDPRGYVLSWNIGAELIQGYQAEEIVGKHFSILYPEEDIELRKPEQLLKTART